LGGIGFLRKVIWNGLLFLASLYLGSLVLAYLFQRNLLYMPDQAVPSQLHLSKMNFSKASIPINNGKVLSSLWRPPKDETRPALIHFHGNAGSHYQRIPIYQAMASEGAGVLAVGYPGYGGNGGNPSEQALYSAAQANYDWLIAQGYPPERIVIVGQSLGTGAATWLASKNDAAGLILEAAYTGLDDMAQRQFFWLPAKLLITDRYRSGDRIAQIDMPLSWIHGTNDELIPFAMGQRLFDAAKKPKKPYPIKNGGHNDLWQRGIDQIIRKEAVRFVAMAMSEESRR
jgi:fermentation-respiration switch protein FrsA (DUF1100 family)